MPLIGTDTNIRWSQFKKLQNHPAGKNYDAETTAEYKASNIRFKQNANAVAVKSADVKVFINTNESWVVTGKTTDYLLKHEQGHYDISVIAAQEFYRELFKLNASTSNDLNTSIQTLNDSIQQKIIDANDRYDIKTNHSQDKTKQDEWNKAIAAEKQKPDGDLINLP